MADSQATIYGKSYGRNIMQLAQQKRSKLYDKVYHKPNQEGKVFFQDRIGHWELEQKTGRQVPTPLSDPNLSRRMGTMKDFYLAKPLDVEDSLKILSDPKSAYTIAGGSAVGRKYDLEVFASALGTSYGGETGIVPVTLGSFNGGSNVIANGSTGLTKVKVKKVSRLMNDFNVENEDRTFFVSPAGIEQLLAEPEVTSSDYATLQALQEGNVKAWMGFNFVMTTLLPTVGDIASGIAIQKMGVCMAEAKSPVIRTGEREDLCYLWQLYASIHIGTTRLEEARVVQCDYDETKAIS
jgi:hypothetical protein